MHRYNKHACWQLHPELIPQNHKRRMFLLTQAEKINGREVDGAKEANDGKYQWLIGNHRVMQTKDKIVPRQDGNQENHCDCNL
jgi:hypothetical protein